MQKIIISSLFIVFVTLSGCKTETPKPEKSVTAVSGTLRVATVNTDSLSANFDMLEVVKREIEETNKRLEADLQRQMNSFKADYENYLKIGATMTLSEQKKKESQLERRQQEIGALQQRYSEQSAVVQMQKMQEIQNYIFTFIADYNKQHDKYNIILPKSMASGVLYADPEMDITGEIIEAINADYSKKSKK
ncbi:MAG: OmpH family outer membrane protein [Bacteroidales bacterium]|jgi:outer membrane protein|nr:OmpH family outer membrane protein [Bacteroidales bacterium]